jgi:group I intron endonuclease
MASVYLITNTANGKRYVGFTGGRVSLRWKQHRKSARDGLVSALHHAIRKYGPEAFEVRTLATTLTPEFALALEQSAIQSLGTRTPAGYNMTTGGEGYLHSDETKAKMSAGRVGKKKTPEHVAKVAAAKRGQTHTPEAKARMSASQQAPRAAKVAEALRLVASGLSHGKAAKAVGLSQATVSKWIRRLNP